MGRTLTAVTPDLLDRILRFHGMSPYVLRLFLSGDVGLRRQISRGVTIIDLKGRCGETKNSFPKFVTSLQALREFSVEQSHSDNVDSLDIASTISQLAPTLTKLVLQKGNYAEFLLPKLSSSRRSLSDCFPNLELLSLDGKFKYSHELMAALPPTLTSLTARQIEIEDSQLIDFSQRLPRCLAYLKLDSYFKEIPLDFWQHLPPALTTLNGVWTSTNPNHPDSEILPLLPRSLTDLSLNTLGVLSIKSLQGLPPSLTTFSTTTTENLDFLPSIFPSLQTLSILIYDAHIVPFLPPTLTKLVGKIISLQVAPSQWPKNLTCIHAMIENEADSIVDSLPTWLQTLTLELTTLSMDTISRLPRSLTGLEVVFYDLNEDVVFPPQLTSLKLNPSAGCDPWLRVKEQEADAFSTTTMPLDTLYDYSGLFYTNVVACFPYHKLPSSLRVLSLPGIIPASKLRFLPDRLEELSIVDIFQDGGFEADSKLQKHAMLDKFDVGREERISESTDFYELKQAEITALLPRTLKKLEINGGAEDLKRCWKLLPPHLETLRIAPGFHKKDKVSAEILFDLCLLKLQRLCIYTQSFGPEHLEALPKSLSSAQLSSEATLSSERGKWLMPAPKNEGPDPWTVHHQPR